MYVWYVIALYHHCIINIPNTKSYKAPDNTPPPPPPIRKKTPPPLLLKTERDLFYSNFCPSGEQPEHRKLAQSYNNQLPVV